MGNHAPPAREELKDRYFTATCPGCDAVNHIIVTYDRQRNHEVEHCPCWSCSSLVHEEDCYLIWTAGSKRSVERSAGQAARLRRTL